MPSSTCTPRPQASPAARPRSVLGRMPTARVTAVEGFAAFETLKRERAKGILMQPKSLTEEQAYTALRKAALRQGRRIADIAQSVVTASQIEF